MPDPCPYCSKIMDGRRPTYASAPTRDHVIPQALGGTRTVLVCRRCNMDKASIPIQVWQSLLERRQDPRAAYVAAFILANPWAVETIVLEPDVSATALIASVPADRLVMQRPIGYGQKTTWSCAECGEVFRKQTHAARHWRSAHAMLCEAP